MSREDVMTALLETLAAGGSFPTVGRRLLHWSKVAEQPALFLRHVGDEYPQRRTGMPPRVVMKCEAWIYSKGSADPGVVPEIALNALLDEIEAALQPAPAFAAQTLGGTVTHAWIEGEVLMHPGDLDGQAMALVPVRVLVPSLIGPTS